MPESLFGELRLDGDDAVGAHREEVELRLSRLLVQHPGGERYLEQAGARSTKRLRTGEPAEGRVAARSDAEQRKR
jgi:hypothetical protein